MELGLIYIYTYIYIYVYIYTYIVIYVDAAKEKPGHLTS